MKRDDRRGYTLLELMFACLLVMIVLYGLYTTLSSMVNFETAALRKSSVDSWSNASVQTMSQEIENATVIYVPSPATTTTSNTIFGCTNWLPQMNGPASGAGADSSLPVVEFYYCLDTTTGPPSPAGTPIPVLRRIAAAGNPAAGISNPTCPAVPATGPGSCTSATSIGGAGTQSNIVIASDVNLASGAGQLFTYTGSALANAVNINFVVGNPNPSGTTPPSDVPTNARIVSPQTSTVNTTVQVERPYMDSND
jgi:type II secretory pathway pseudopilin PulG